MREILFRGKHIHALPKNGHLDGTWIYGYLCDENHINSPESEGEFLIDPETACQYTGLADKDGRKIFEGDIVKHFYDPKIPSKVDEGIISWDGSECGFHRSSREDNCFYKITDHCKYEVIGNIFDNPELTGKR